MSHEYSLNYVKFFRHRNNLENYNNFEQIKELTLKDDRIHAILNELQDWPCYEIKNHKNVDHPLHKLSFIAELGFNKNDPGLNTILQKIFKNQSTDGPFTMLLNIPKQYGGTGQKCLSWLMCDASVILYSAIKLNNGIDDPIRKAIDSIIQLISENGWHCIAATNLGKFRGPGRKSDPCPYATMFSLKMLGLTGENEYVREKEIAINSIFTLWKMRKERKPYLFGMGTDFNKLKLPFVWYDILNMVDTLSLFKQITKEEPFLEMLQLILSKETERGLIPESIYLKAKHWDFGQKKEVSEYMNAIVERIKKRLNIHS